MSATWYMGPSTPDPALGVDGDYYVNAASASVYSRVSGAWSLLAGGSLVLGPGSILASMLAAGAALANLGYTPANKAGDTFTGAVVIPRMTLSGPFDFSITGDATWSGGVASGGMIDIVDLATSQGYGVREIYRKPLALNGNTIAHALLSRFDDMRNGTTFWNRWEVASSPLHPGSGLYGAPTATQLFDGVIAERNPQNRYADHGYAAYRNAVNNWVGGEQMIPETFDFSALLGGERRGYPSLFAYFISESYAAATDTGRSAKTYNGFLVEPNALAPNGRAIRASGYQPFPTAVSSIAASGAGYVVGDIIPVAGGTVGERLSPASIEVTAINGSGGVTGARLFEPRSYIVAPSNPVATSGGTGSGATFNLTWSDEASERPQAVIEASHVWQNGVDFTGATFLGNPFGSNSFTVDNSGNLIASSLKSYGGLRLGPDGHYLYASAPNVLTLAVEVSGGGAGYMNIKGSVTGSATIDGPAGYLGLSAGGADQLAIEPGGVSVLGDHLNIATAKTPASSSAAGAAGDVCWDSSYLYVCVAANSWKRVALSTF